jgi:predicted site-specific integrase-resolvase
MRSLTSGEAAELLGVDHTYLRKLHREGKIADVETTAGNCDIPPRAALPAHAVRRPAPRALARDTSSPSCDRARSAVRWR